MNKTELWSRLARKGTNPEELADLVMRQTGLLPALLEGLDVAEPEVKFGCSKVLRLLSERAPATLYPQIDLFIALSGPSTRSLAGTRSRLSPISPRSTSGRGSSRSWMPISSPSAARS